MPSTCDTAANAFASFDSAARGILLVEDEAAVRHVLTRFLSVNGFHVFPAADAHAAESLWLRHCDEIGVLVTDMVLPGGVTGSRLATLLQGQRPDLEVILTSGYHTDQSQLVTSANPGMHFIAKPYHPNDLLELIRGALSAPSLL